MTVKKIEPTRLFSYTWHPYATDPKADYSKETPTLVEFTLEKIPAGTRLTVVETGFESIPKHRIAEAFGKHEGGWAEQMQNVKKHIEK